MFIPDPGSDFFLPGIRIVSIPDPGRINYFNPKKWFLSSRKYDPSCSSRILTFYPSRIQGSKVTGSRIRQHCLNLFFQNLCTWAKWASARSISSHFWRRPASCASAASPRMPNRTVLAIKKTTPKNPKNHIKNPLKMFFFGFLKIFYENNTNYSLWNWFFMNK